MAKGTLAVFPQITRRDERRRSMQRLWRVGLVFLCFSMCLVPGALAQSQATTGVIEGTVVDETGGGLPGAAVSIKNAGTNFEKVLTAGSDGRFRGVLLPLGPYRVTVTLAGFSTLVREGLGLAGGQEDHPQRTPQGCGGG